MVHPQPGLGKKAKSKMNSGDFLKKRAKTPLCEFFIAAGAVCALRTNSQEILAAARDSFIPIDGVGPDAEFTLRLWVDHSLTAGPPWPKPFYRGLDHLIFGGFDSESSVLVDLRRRSAIGRLSPALAADQSYWKGVIFPNLLTAFGGRIGLTEIHCACVVHNGDGLLLAGGSGSGKSTLTLALAECGFSVLSDDWTYFSVKRNQLKAWGLLTPVKLLPDAAVYFAALNGLEPIAFPNGEFAFKVDPEIQLGALRSRHCHPRWLVFLKRQITSSFCLSELQSTEAFERLKGDLALDTPDVMRRHLETIKKLSELKTWAIQYGGDPHATAGALRRFCEDSTQVNRSSNAM